MKRALAPIGLALVALGACVGTDNLSGGGSSGTSGTAVDPGGADVSIEPSSLELPETDCGAQAQKAFVILNRSKTPVDYKVRSIDPTFTLGGSASGVIPAGGAATVDVRATPNAAQELSSTLVVEINGEARAYSVKVRGSGATFEASPSAIDFGDVRKENGAETKITVRNTGRRPLDTTLEAVAATADFDVLPVSVRAAPDASTEVTVRLKPGVSNAAPLVAQFKPRASGICGALPTIDVRGKRITTDVTIDAVDWGDVGCKTNPADRDATIKNYGPSTILYTSSITGTSFSIVSNGGGSVPSGSETNPAQQTIKLHAVPGTVPGQKDETLSITYGGVQTSTGKVRAFVVGLVLAITPSSAVFVSNGTNEQRRVFNLSNSGKFGGYSSFNVTYRTTGAGFRAENGSTSFINFPFSNSVDVVFRATQSGVVNGSLLVDGTVCSQTSVALTGNNP